LRVRYPACITLNRECGLCSVGRQGLWAGTVRIITVCCRQVKIAAAMPKPMMASAPSMNERWGANRWTTNSKQPHTGHLCEA
jgi:hypothetical protein